jgi:hypothetical protein
VIHMTHNLIMTVQPTGKERTIRARTLQPHSTINLDDVYIL